MLDKAGGEFARSLLTEQVVGRSIRLATCPENAQRPDVVSRSSSLLSCTSSGVCLFALIREMIG